MSQSRFFVTNKAIDSQGGSVVIDDPTIVNQIKRVLRLTSGSQIVVLDGQGALYRCRIDSLSKNEIRADIVSSERASGDCPVQVEVALPLLKGDRFDWALEKLTELGAACVAPIICERTVVRGKSEEKIGRWQTIVREASEQCERATIPRVVRPACFTDYLSRAQERAHLADTLRIICTERADAPSLYALLHKHLQSHTPPSHICVIIGPEGGLTEDEVKTAVASGFQPASLGERILRSETAALSAVCQIVSVAGDTGGMAGGFPAGTA